MPFRPATRGRREPLRRLEPGRGDAEADLLLGHSATGTALSGAPSAVGTYTVLASFAGSTDYTSAAASTTFTIGPADVNFQSLSVFSTLVAEPLMQDGFDFTSSGTEAGHALLVEGPGSTPKPGGWPSTVLMAAYAGTTINMTQAGGGTFTLDALNVDSYSPAQSATIVGYDSNGQVIDTKTVTFSFGHSTHATDTVTLDWSGLSKINVSWWQNSSGGGAPEFGAIDNIFVVPGAASPPVTVAATPAWQNPVNPLDVLGTGGPIVPADALAVINYLNTNPAGLPLPSTFTAASDYVDVLGLGTVVPADALANHQLLECAARCAAQRCRRPWRAPRLRAVSHLSAASSAQQRRRI